MFSLDLVMIVRDEARCIRRCLDSVRAHVDRLWVLDTGSVDPTPALAAAGGARVHHAKWTDDFAAARNAALALGDADWWLVLDADEWLAGGAEALAGLRRMAPDRLGQVRIVSQVDGGEAPSWLTRVLPRGVGYTGRVHEQVDSALPRQRLALQIGHDGYLPAQMARKRGRNRALLQRMLAERPGDDYVRYQLGKDHELAGEFESAETHYARAYDGIDPRSGWRHDLVLRRLYCLKRLARHAQALALADAEAPHWNHSPDFHFTLGDVLLDWAATTPPHAPRLLPLAEASWQRALRIGENPQLQDTVLGRGSYLAAHNRAVLYGGLGDTAAAAHWRERSATMRAAA
jgi:glycosyltransferase involved in cell wall biosynthesis